MGATGTLGRAVWNPSERRPTAGVRLGVGTAAILLGGVASSLLGGVAADALGTSSPAVPVAALGAGSLLVVAGLARTVDRRRLRGYGLRLDRAWATDCGFGLALGAALQTGIVAVGVAGGWVRVVGVATPAAVLPDLVRLAALFVAVGVWEEVVVRGWLLTNLAEGLRFVGDRAAAVGALLASAAVFGLGHANNPEASAVSTLLIVCAGVFLGAGYLLTGQLGVPIGVHVAWNFVQGPVYGFGVSGFDVGAAVVRTDVTGPAWLTGGAFGPEAGALGAAAIAAGTLALVGWGRHRQGGVRIHPSITAPPRREDGTDADAGAEAP